MDQTKLPLFDALKAFSDQQSLSFHVPGHKNGTVFNGKGIDFFKDVLKIDLTELNGLDDLHNPTTIIKEAESLTASFFQAMRSFFLVGGSTVGNLAMIMATCEEGDLVIVQRNSHKSVINALRLAKVNPIFIGTAIDNAARFSTCIIEKELLNVLKQYPEAKAIIITNPNYYGYSINLDTIIEKAHEFGIAVLVDEAHGAHFQSNSKYFPKSALASGADIVVHSAHKTLPAMTMGSYLHYNSQFVELDRLKFFLQLFQTSSPSYPIMASLDLARHYIANLKEKDLDKIIDNVKQFVSLLATVPQIKVVTNKDYTIDPLRVTIQSKCSLSGFQLQKILEEDGIYTELADPYNVLFVLPLASFQSDNIVMKIKEKLKDFPVLKDIVSFPMYKRPLYSKLSLSYKELESKERELVSVVNCKGRIIAEEIIPYPPGVPLLLSGEFITKTHIEDLSFFQNAGAYFQGGRDYFKTGIEVYKND